MIPLDLCNFSQTHVIPNSCTLSQFLQCAFDLNWLHHGFGASKETIVDHTTQNSTNIDLICRNVCKGCQRINSIPPLLEHFDTCPCLQRGYCFMVRIVMSFNNFCTSFQALKMKVQSSNTIHYHLCQRVRARFLNMWMHCPCFSNEVYDAKCQYSQPYNYFAFIALTNTSTDNLPWILTETQVSCWAKDTIRWWFR